VRESAPFCINQQDVTAKGYYFSMAAYLFDLDGTLYQGNAAIPGAPELIARLRLEGTPFRFVTNTTSRPRSAIVARLRGYGFVLQEEEVVTALRAGAQQARDTGCESVLPLVTPSALQDLTGLVLVGGTSGVAFPASPPPRFPRAVIVGDLGPLWSFDLMQQAFTALMAGARLIALSHDRYWMSADGLTIDCGAFVRALEYATGTTSTLAGKPSPAFYQAAVASMGLDAGTDDVIMVGDDIRSDVGGAQAAGCRGFLVQTGKFREDTLTGSGITPDRILSSIADLLD
jgi:phospholysine phosphohistidine inorganic pyrophosphate phosphatase